MNLKTSFCSKSLIKSDLRRFWWISALHTLLIFLTFSLINISDDYMSNYYNQQCHYFDSNAYYNAEFVWVLSFIFPVALGVMLFSYLQSGKSSASLHSIPVLRRTHFVSHYISGIIMYTMPLVINGIILWLFKLNGDIAGNYRLLYVFYTFAIALVYQTVAFTGACFVSNVCGNSIASFVFIYILALLPAFANTFVTFFLDINLKGYAYNDEYAFINFLYRGPKDFAEIKTTLIYIGLSLAFTVGAYLFYRARKLEKHSEAVAFSKITPIFIYGVGICSGAMGYGYFESIWDYTNPLLLIPFGLIGIIIAEMIVKKSFKVFGVYKKLLWYSTFIVVLFATVQFDLTGYESRVPEVDQIESVNFIMPNSDSKYIPYEYRYSISHKEIYFDYEYEPTITNPDEIKLVCDLHKAAIKVEEENFNYYYGNNYRIEYTLKNGKTLIREYNMDRYHDELMDTLAPVMETNIIRQDHFPIIRPVEYNDIYITVRDVRLVDVYKHADEELKKKLLAALREDLRTIPYEEFNRDGNNLTYLGISYTVPSHYEDGTPVPTDDLRTIQETYYISRAHKNTIAVLEEIGLYDALPTGEDIKCIGVGIHDPGKLELYDQKQNFSIDSHNYSFNKLIEDPQEIKEVYEYARTYGFDNYGKYELIDTYIGQYDDIGYYYLEFFTDGDIYSANYHSFDCKISFNHTPPKCMLYE